MLEAYPPDLQDFVQQKIASGEFKSADEFAVRAATLYRSMEQRHADLKQSIVDAIAELDAGLGIELKNDEELHEFAESIKRRGRERLRELKGS